MTQESLQTGSIDRFQITSKKGNSIDLSAGVVDFRLYESVLSNTITATATVIETGNQSDGESVSSIQGAIDGLPIRGGEESKITIRDAHDESISFNVLVNRVRNASPESTKDLYLLDFASLEYFSNDTVRVIERYDGKISESIKLILRDVLRTDKNLDIDDTMISYNFMGNDRKPFYTCTWLAQKSVPTTNTQGGTAGFLFYQTIDSFKFKSIDTLLSESPRKSFIFNAGDKGDDDDIIINYTIDRDIDLHENLTLGTYGCSAIFFDPVSFDYKIQNFDIMNPDHKKSRKSPEKTEFAGEMVNPKIRGEAKSQQTPRNQPNQISRMMSIVLDTGTLPAGKSSEKELEDWKNKTKTKQNYDATNTAIQSIMRYNQLFMIQTNITIPGDFSIRAGDTVKCTFPQLEGSKNTEQNKASSGIYMVAHVCHKITPENTLTSLSLVRDSFGK